MLSLPWFPSHIGAPPVTGTRERMLDTSRTTDSLSRLLELGFERQRDAPVITEDVRLDRHSHRVTTTCGAMGTHVSVTALGTSRSRLDDAIGRTFEEMERLIAIFSRYQSDSAVSELNATGWLRGPPEEMTRVVDQALALHALTNGAFDVSVAPLLELFRDRMGGGGGGDGGGATPRPPTDGEIRDARALVGAHAVIVTERQIRLGRCGMRLTLDGIAKGFIVDCMADALERARIANFLLDAGGDIRARGRKEGGQPWLVAVQDPGHRGAFPDVLHLGNAAVATSGAYERHFDAERQYPHIVDAATGRSPNACASVSVVAGSAMLADALATSVFIMGPGPGLAFVESRAGCECLIIDAGGRKLRSRGWKSAASASPVTPSATA